MNKYSEGSSSRDVDQQVIWNSATHAKKESLDWIWKQMIYLRQHAPISFNIFSLIMMMSSLLFWPTGCSFSICKGQCTCLFREILGNWSVSRGCEGFEKSSIYYIEFYCIVCSIYQTGLFVMCMVNEVKILFRLYMYQSKILLVFLLIVSWTTCLTEVQRIWYRVNL